ncbi:YdeI/OmpD-associated family protein [Variovorax sp. PCZ-1]|uniref:YdeI/OmpD-associated family protein n=1 Tax=Variovorax sp. PCZ-1 TaxID=2835533 RepID=UPI001BD0CF9E|nr:YdeI/OmpD-associated family protein [Variovorax sp. PCZ-1]MBS7806946.1 YdeI/OmpD-associated family protein [Variovorax sp. PCZ-1]
MEDSVQPATRAAWRAWLAKHHERTEGVWLITYKKAAGKPRIEYHEAVEEALCFGWVDSKPGKVDEERTKLWFAPRKARSGWSRPNKERVARLIAADLMQPAGLARIEAAKQDGSWASLDAVEDLVVDADLAAALASYKNAAQNFEAFPRSAKRGILEWIAQAKRAQTRAARIAETARLAQDNLRANQWKPK